MVQYVVSVGAYHEPGTLAKPERLTQGEVGVEVVRTDELVTVLVAKEGRDGRGRA